MPALLAFVAAFSTLITSVLAEQVVKREVRDASGKLLYESTKRGHQTEVRDPFGKLLIKTKTSSDGKTTVCSPSGRLLYKSK